MRARPDVKEYIKRRDAAVLVAVRDDNIQELCCENRANEPDGYKGLYGFNDR